MATPDGGRKGAEWSQSIIDSRVVEDDWERMDYLQTHQCTSTWGGEDLERNNTVGIGDNRWWVSI